MNKNEILLLELKNCWTTSISMMSTEQLLDVLTNLK